MEVSAQDKADAEGSQYGGINTGANYVHPPPQLSLSHAFLLICRLLQQAPYFHQERSLFNKNNDTKLPSTSIVAFSATSCSSG